jgi:hypothetical protein
MMAPLACLNMTSHCLPKLNGTRKLGWISLSAPSPGIESGSPVSSTSSLPESGLGWGVKNLYAISVLITFGHFFCYKQVFTSECNVLLVVFIIIILCWTGLPDMATQKRPKFPRKSHVFPISVSLAPW